MLIEIISRELHKYIEMYTAWGIASTSCRSIQMKVGLHYKSPSTWQISKVTVTVTRMVVPQGCSESERVCILLMSEMDEDDDGRGACWPNVPVFAITSSSLPAWMVFFDFFVSDHVLHGLCLTCRGDLSVYVPIHTRLNHLCFCDSSFSIWSSEDASAASLSLL